MTKYKVIYRAPSNMIAPDDPLVLELLAVRIEYHGEFVCFYDTVDPSMLDLPIAVFSAHSLIRVEQL